MQNSERVDISFERPPFAAPDRMDRSDYLHPSLSVGGMSVGVYRNDIATLDVSDANDPAAVYMLPLMLRATPACHLWKDGISQPNPPFPPGAINCFDLRQRWQAELRFPFHSVHFYVPQVALDELTEELRQPRIERLTCSPGTVTVDQTAYHLAKALLPTLEERAAMPSLLSDQILCALRIHLACTHGGLTLPCANRSGLSMDQKRLVRDLMLDCLEQELRLADLARHCRMPIHLFSKAFRISFGVSPHGWRHHARIERARKLLEATKLPVAQVALLCGFYDQPHFTRCFARDTGVTPAAYRRRRQGG